METYLERSFPAWTSYDAYLLPTFPAFLRQYLFSPTTFLFVGGQDLPAESYLPVSCHSSPFLFFLHLSRQMHFERMALFISPFPHQICKHRVCEPTLLAPPYFLVPPETQGQEASNLPLREISQKAGCREQFC